MKDDFPFLKNAMATGIPDPLASRVCPLSLPLPPNPKMGWGFYPLFKGTTSVMESLSCHASTLSTSHVPHPPHAHKEEEILLLLSGEIDLILPKGRTQKDLRRKRLTPGEFVYYPHHFTHTLETVSPDPANYLMYKWRDKPCRFGAPLAFGVFSIPWSKSSEVGDGFRTQRVFEGPTGYLEKLHCHGSTLTPGSGYDPHADPYDVAIIVLEGEVETLGQRVEPHGVVFYGAGEPHGMYNPGATTAKYLVFEFHRSRSTAAALGRRIILPVKHLIPPTLRRKVRRALRRLGGAH